MNPYGRKKKPYRIMGNEGEERSEGDGRLPLIIYQVYYTSSYCS
jgi:hypothetical protein